MTTNSNSLINRFEDLDEYWSPLVIGEVNDQYVKIAKLKGEFVWHDHSEEDELFYIVKGSLDIHLKNKVIHLEKGDFYIIPRGMMHKPEAQKECWVMLFEKKSTKHTGDVQTVYTKTIKDQLGGK